MAANAINNFFHGAHGAGLPGLGAYGGIGLATSTKAPQLERYHEEHGYTKSKGGKKGNVALSALTLLAFLFFLHILQNCIQEHMYEMKSNAKIKQNLNFTLPNINLPNVIIVDSSSNSNNGRDNLKGDEGDLEYWPLQNTAAKKEAQNRVFKKRPKKQNAQQQSQQDRNTISKVKQNMMSELMYPMDAEPKTISTRMHRIDDLP